LKNAPIIAGYFLVAAAFFTVGRLTAPDRADVRELVAPIAASDRPVNVEDIRLNSNSGTSKPARVDDLRIGIGPAVAPVLSGKDDSNPRPGNVTADDISPSIGARDAKVILLEVSDFQCPVCRRAWGPLKKLNEDFPGEVLLVFKQNPLKMHQNALNAAAASMAAARQGRFWEYSDRLFDNQRSLSESDLIGYASSMGFDMDRFARDYRDDSIRARALSEGEAAAKLGARGTPSFFINGRKQVGWASYQSLAQRVKLEIEAVDDLIADGTPLKEARIMRVGKNLSDPALLLDSELGIEFNGP